ncbi:MAG TPA: MFS transporter [Sphingomonadaceae bacterium]|nr:MFS transporter [Sphingomonadaceae bacterium]
MTVTGLPLKGPALTLLLVSSLTVMSGATIAASLPALEAHFDGTPNVGLLARLVLTVPAAAIVISAPLAGLLADRIGRRPLLVLAIILFAVAGASGLVLDSLPALLVGRAALGIGVGAIMTVATALAGDYFAGPQRQAFMGRQGAFTGIGGLAFITGGGLLAGLHWRAPFAIYALALLLIPLVITQLRNPPAPPAQPIAGEAVAPARANRGLVLLLYVGALLNSIAFYLIPTQLPFLLADRGIDTPFLAGLAIGFATIVSAAVSLNYRRISQAASPGNVFAAGFALMGISYGLVAFSPDFAVTLTAMAIAGGGLGLMMPAFSFTALELAPTASRGAIVGGLTSAIFLGQFISPFISQPWAATYSLASAFGAMGVLLGCLAAFIVAAGPVMRGLTPVKAQA